jgi:hypothetical protein
VSSTLSFPFLGVKDGEVGAGDCVEGACANYGVADIFGKKNRAVMHGFWNRYLERK